MGEIAFDVEGARALDVVVGLSLFELLRWWLVVGCCGAIVAFSLRSPGSCLPQQAV